MTTKTDPNQNYTIKSSTSKSKETMVKRRMSESTIWETSC